MLGHSEASHSQTFFKLSLGEAAGGVELIEQFSAGGVCESFENCIIIHNTRICDYIVTCQGWEVILGTHKQQIFGQEGEKITFPAKIRLAGDIRLSEQVRACTGADASRSGMH